jgi:hypothetical protein
MTHAIPSDPAVKPEPVGPVRIRSANCAAGDHDDCVSMVEQDVPELGITDCLCDCHADEAITGVEWEMPDYRSLLERLAKMPKEASGRPSEIIAAYDAVANEAGRLLKESPRRVEVAS